MHNWKLGSQEMNVGIEYQYDQDALVSGKECEVLDGYQNHPGQRGGYYV